jgi:hypothetical protein
VTSARRRVLALADATAMRSASCSALKPVSLRITSPMTSLTTSSKRDMCAPFCFGPEIDEAFEVAREELRRPSPAAMRMTFSTPVSPTRERETWTVGPTPGRRAGL